MDRCKKKDAVCSGKKEQTALDDYLCNTAEEFMPQVIQIRTNTLMNQWRIQVVVNG